MSTTQYSYTGTEALEMFKQAFPDDYQQRIDVGKALIIRLKNIYQKSTYQEAYQRYLNSGCSNESHVMMLAALQQLIVEERESTDKLVELRDQLLVQQEANEISTTIDPTDKKCLRQFYRNKIDEINAKLEQRAYAIEVIDPIVITHPNLFTPTESLSA